MEGDATNPITRLGPEERLDLARGGRQVVLDARKVGWEPLPPKYTTGVLAKYRKLVSSAAEGAVTG